MGRELAARAAAQRNGTNGNGQNGDGEQDGRVRTLAGQLERMIPEYQAAMPKGREATRLVRDATTCLRIIRNLDKCDAESFLGALMTCAQLDLRPGVASLGHAWPLPFWDNRTRGFRAQLVVGYKGYIELGYRSGKLTGIASRIVYENELDGFAIEFREDGDKLTHKPSYRGMRGEPVCFYSVARIVGGGYSLTDPMSVEEMRAHRDAHAPRDRHGKITGPWIDHFLPMGKKTMILRNFATLPKSAEMWNAMAADSGIRIDLSPDADAAEVTERPPRVLPGHLDDDESGTAVSPEDLGDWGAMIDAIADAEDGERGMAEVREAVAGGMDPGKGDAIIKAIEAKVAQVAGPAGAA